MSKSIWLVILAGFVALLIGCHAGGGNAPKINTFENQIAEKDSTVSNGRFADISFPSGAVIKCTADKAFQDGVKITVEEDKVFVEYDYATRAPVYYYLYKVSALSPSSNALEGDVAVSTVEQPVSITLPNNISDSGTCFVGFRADKNDPWRYSLIEDSVNANILPLRLAKRAGRNCTFNLFRLGYEFRLFVFDSFKEDEAVITSASATTENKITVKDSKYAEDLNLKVKVTGEKLDLLNTNSVICRITYRSNYLNPVELKADGSIVKQTDSSDKGVSGGFLHSFELTNLKVESQMSGEAILSLVLNLNDIKLEDFPTAFLIEFYSKNDIEKTLPFIYAQAFNFETEEKQEEPEPEPFVTYSITYDLDGGEPTDGNPTSYTVEDEITLSNPKKDGYTFTGWTGTDLDGLTTQVTIEKGSTGDRSYKANWTKVAFTITYDLKGGTLAEENPDGYNTASETFKLNEPTKAGYEFIGWTGSNGDTPQKPVSVVQGSKSNLNYVANYSIINYELTYDLDGGKLANDNPKTYNVETEEITLSNPKKDGYTFTGWTGTDLDGPTTQVTIKKGSTGDRSYKANWTKVAFTITYDLKGGTLAEDNPDGYNTASETFELKEPTKTGYTFIGWTGSNGDTPQTSLTIAQGSTGNKTYTANWSIKSYNITINKGAGINTVTGDGQHEYNSSVTATCTMLAGYDFDSWTGDFTTATFNMPAKDVKLTANAKPINYSLTYTNVENCTFAKANPTTYTVETADFTLTNPTKDYYNFDGWVINDGEPVETVTITKGTHENRKYTAKFTPATYSITLVPNGGTVEYTTKDYNVETADFTLPTPTRTGCEFLGWTGSNGNTPQTSVTIAKGSTTGDKTYTANWKLNLTLAIASDTGSVFEPVVNNLYKLSPTFSITPVVADGVVLTDSEKANILSAIKVTDSTSTTLNTISKSWENGKIALSFSENLTASSTYTISSGDIDAVNLTCTPVSFTTICFSGSGTSDDPFLVATAEQLNMVRKYLSCYFKQTEDISLASFDNWEPIGKDNNNRFEGSYDGDEKKITKLTINDQQLSYYGMFGYSIGLLKNINAEEFSINIDISDDNGFVGGICGSCWGSLESCYVASSTIIMSGGKSVGGICGGSHSRIEKCHVASSTISMNGGSEIGGICGHSYSNLSYCYVASSTISTSDNGGFIGGICGVIMPQYSIKFCYIASSTLSIGDRGAIGGICGGFHGQTIDSCFVYLENLGKIRKDEFGSAKLGLIVGIKKSDNTVTNCFTNLTGDLCGDGEVSSTCYDGVTTFDIFKTKTWSDDKTYEGNSTVWSGYKPISGSSWPPDLFDNPRPQP